MRARRLAPLSIFDEVSRLVLAADHDVLLKIPVPFMNEVANELAITARRELTGAFERVERDAVLSEADQNAVQGLARRLVEQRFGAAVDVG